MLTCSKTMKLAFLSRKETGKKLKAKLKRILDLVRKKNLVNMNSKNKMLTIDDFFVREFRGCDVQKLKETRKYFSVGIPEKAGVSELPLTLLNFQRRITDVCLPICHSLCYKVFNMTFGQESRCALY